MQNNDNNDNNNNDGGNDNTNNNHKNNNGKKPKMLYLKFGIYRKRMFSVRLLLVKKWKERCK